MAIYKTDDGYFVASSYGVWIPGGFDTARAAKYMMRFNPHDQYVMWKQWLSKGNVPCPPITFEEMQSWKKTGNFLEGRML